MILLTRCTMRCVGTCRRFAASGLFSLRCLLCRLVMSGLLNRLYVTLRSLRFGLMLLVILTLVFEMGSHLKSTPICAMSDVRTTEQLLIRLQEAYYD